MKSNEEKISEKVRRFIMTKHKFQKEVKIEETIPFNEEFQDATYMRESSTDYPGGTTTIIYVESKSKEKVFEEYVKEFYASFEPNLAGSFIKFRIEPEVLSMRNKLGLLWHIVKEKGGNLMNLSNLLSMIFYKTSTRFSIGTETSLNVYELLPESFIESFKEE